MMLAKIVATMAMSVALVAPSLAAPTGVWEFSGKDTRVDVVYCGDGTALCGTLIWLSDADYNEQYKPYLNTLMVKAAKPAGANRWKGDMNLFGHNAAGTITQTGPDAITLKGCVMMVVCKTYELHRYAE